MPLIPSALIPGKCSIERGDGKTADQVPRNQRKHRSVFSQGMDTPAIQEALELGVQKGHLLTSFKEPGLPQYKRSDDDNWLNNGHDAWIILKRDNMGNSAHGEGGAGGTDCGAIDIVCGLLSGAGDARKKCGGDQIETGPNPCLDAARLYLTQRGNVDQYFALPKGNHQRLDNTSGAVLKADHIRLIGRGSVKIFAGKGQFQGTGFFGEKTSQGGRITHQSSIDLIAGDPKSLQPLVKGENLRKCLVEVCDAIQSLSSVLALQHKTNARAWMAMATVTAPLGGTGPAMSKGLHNCIQSIEDILRGVKMEFIKMNYLGIPATKDEPFIAGGKNLITGECDYILSRHVSTT